MPLPLIVLIALGAAGGIAAASGSADIKKAKEKSDNAKDFYGNEVDKTE
ncbi:MAG: hypothetical protein ISN28_01455 [Ectothiorhodospiraceae bacterium AqS1]|nr:hypothetical protein [Ectothiorhodospiraceae bacterium AqS1]